MNILIVVSNGLSPHTVRPIEYLLTQGHTVILFGMGNPYPDGRKNFVHVYGQGDDVGIIEQLKQIARLQPIDLIHVLYASIHLLYAILADIAPVVVSILGSDVNDFITVNSRGKISWNWRMPKPWYLEQSFPKVKHIITDDIHAVASYKFVSSKIPQVSVLHLGIDLQKFFPPTVTQRIEARKYFGFEPEDIVILSPRVFSEYYHQLEIFEGFLSVAQQYPQAKLVFKVFNPLGVEETEKLQNKLETITKERKLERQVVFLQSLPAEILPRLYWASNAIINCPKTDAFPVTFAEAAATKTSILTIWHSSYKGTFIEKIQNGIFTTPDKIGKTIEAYLKSSDGDELVRDEMCIMAQHQFDHSSFCKELLRIYTLCAQESQNNAAVATSNCDIRFSVLIDATQMPAQQLRKLIASVLFQKYKTYEIIVGCKDFSVVTEYPDKEICWVICPPDLNNAQIFTFLTTHTNGSALLLLDQNSIEVHPWLLLAGAAQLSDITNVVCCNAICDTSVYDYSNATVEDLAFEPWVHHTATIVRRDLWENIATNKHNYICDEHSLYEFWLTALEKKIKIGIKNIKLTLYSRNELQKQKLSQCQYNRTLKSNKNLLRQISLEQHNCYTEDHDSVGLPSAIRHYRLLHLQMCMTPAVDFVLQQVKNLKKILRSRASCMINPTIKFWIKLYVLRKQLNRYLGN